MQAIAYLTAQYSKPPTVREISIHTGVHISTIQHDIEWLVSVGKVTKREGKWRSLALK